MNNIIEEIKEVVMGGTAFAIVKHTEENVDYVVYTYIQEKEDKLFDKTYFTNCIVFIEIKTGEVTKFEKNNSETYFDAMRIRNEMITGKEQITEEEALEILTNSKKVEEKEVGATSNKTYKNGSRTVEVKFQFFGDRDYTAFFVNGEDILLRRFDTFKEFHEKAVSFLIADGEYPNIVDKIDKEVYELLYDFLEMSEEKIRIEELEERLKQIETSRDFYMRAFQNLGSLVLKEGLMTNEEIKMITSIDKEEI
ncbi:hypothetical protein KK120_18760 [Virgibacillus dakarensis]|nr:hypothetical protein [Virgibacillus dakarensis]